MNIITYGEYINGMLNALADYINHLVRYDKKLREIMLKMASISKTKDIKIYKDLIQYLKGVRAAHQEATELFDELDQIGKWYSDGEEISYYVQIFNEKFMNTELPLYLKMPCDLIGAALEADKKMAEGMPTGGAAEVVDIVEDIRVPLEEENEADEKVILTEEQESQEETGTVVLEGGIRYCNYENESEANPDGLCKDEVEISDAIEQKPTGTQENKSKNSVNQQVQPKPTPYPQPQNKQNPFVKPFIMPCHGKIVGQYGEPRKTHIHNGIDIAVPMGTPIKAIADGKVYYAGANDPKGYGKYIILGHNFNGKTITSEYGHLSSWIVSVGQIVKQGQIIGYSGNTGHSDGPHCHLTIREGVYKGIHVDPYKYIKY